MIDCRTQHGYWMAFGSAIITDIGEDTIKTSLVIIDTKIKTNILKGIIIPNNTVAFFDLNGNYTGFRLKQLK